MRNSLFDQAVVIACCGFCLGGVPAATNAQQPFVPTAPAAPAASPSAAPVTFGSLLGRTVRDAEENHSVFTLQATQPRDSKAAGQKVRLTIEDTTLGGTKTRILSLNTGKHKTVAQFCETLRDIFRKYESARQNAVGSEVGKIGDLKYGGEIRFVAESSDRLRYDLKTEGEEDHSTRLTVNEVATISALLEPTPTAGSER